MGDREDPARLVFTAKEGKAIATSLIDLGNRFRLIINDVNCKKTEKPMPSFRLQLHSGHRNQIFRQVLKHGSWQAVHIIQLSPMT